MNAPCFNASGANVSRACTLLRGSANDFSCCLIPCVDDALLARKISNHTRRLVAPLVSGLFDATRTPLAFMSHGWMVQAWG